MNGCPHRGCEKANDTITFEDLKAHLESECSQVEVDCVENCGVKVKRGNQVEHF